MIDGVRVLNPTEVPGMMYLVPLAKSPHGADFSPDGRYVIGGGKLAPYVTVYDFEKFLKAAAATTTDRRGRRIPVLKLRGHQGGRSAGGPGPAAHPVRRPGLRLHLALRRVGDRQMEARPLQRQRFGAGGGQDPGPLLGRPPGDRSRRYSASPGEVPGLDEQAVEGSPPERGPVPAGVEPADRHHRRPG